MPGKPYVVVTRKLPDSVETRMMELFRVKLNLEDRPLEQAELIDAVKTADVLVPTVTDRIDNAVLSQAGPNLRLIASFGTGVDHIDLASARQRGITVTNTPGVLTEDTADMTMALILATARRVSEGERLIRSGDWKGWGQRLHRLAPPASRLHLIVEGRRACRLLWQPRGQRAVVDLLGMELPIDPGGESHGLHPLDLARAGTEGQTIQRVFNGIGRSGHTRGTQRDVCHHRRERHRHGQRDQKALKSHIPLTSLARPDPQRGRALPGRKFCTVH